MAADSRRDRLPERHFAEDLLLDYAAGNLAEPMAILVATHLSLCTDCRAAVAWVWRHAAEFGGDPDRIYVMGKSSGGHVGGMMVTTDWAGLHDIPADAVKGALLVSGMYDLEPVRLTFRNEWLKLDKESAARNSPIRHIPTPRCPLVVAFGSLESAEFKRQSRAFVEAWRADGTPCRLIELPDRPHFSIDADLNDPSGPLLAAMLEMMGLAPAAVGAQRVPLSRRG